LSTVKDAIEWTKTMTWKGVKPIVELVEQVYEKGVTLCKKAFRKIEDRLIRDEALPKYYVKIIPE